MIDPYATGVLFKEHHDRLVAGLAGFARDAGIAPRWIYTPLADVCGSEEADYVRLFKFHQADGVVNGLCYVRKSEDANPGPRMSALAGALVRNFVRARVMTLGTVIDLLGAGEPPEATCLLIPNFFVSKAEGGTVASWQVNNLYDLLTRRAQLGQQTVLYATSIDGLRREYGTAFGTMIRNSFNVVEI